MTVSELIEFLQTKPADMPIAYRLYSEQCVLKADDIEVTKRGMPRVDGWVQNYRADKESQDYLLFPGN